MRRPSLIATPRPTPEETARLLRIPRKDAEFVRALVDEWARSPEIIREFGEPTNGHGPNSKRKNETAKRATRENHHR